MSAKKFTTAQEAILEDLQRTGGFVLAAMVNGREQYRTMQGTCERLTVDRRTLRALVDKGALKPANDGLFDRPQTYRLASNDN